MESSAQAAAAAALRAKLISAAPISSTNHDSFNGLRRSQLAGLNGTSSSTPSHRGSNGGGIMNGTSIGSSMSKMLSNDTGKAIVNSIEVYTKIKKLSASGGVNYTSMSKDDQAKFDLEVFQVLTKLKEQLDIYPDDISRLIADKDLIMLPMWCLGFDKEPEMIKLGLEIIQALASRTSDCMALLQKHECMERIVKLLRISLYRYDGRKLMFLVLYTIKRFASLGGQDGCELVFSADGLHVILSILEREIVLHSIEERRPSKFRATQNIIDGQSANGDASAPRSVIHVDMDEDYSSDEEVGSLKRKKQVDPNKSYSDMSIFTSSALLASCVHILRYLSDHPPTPSAPSFQRFPTDRLLHVLTWMISQPDSELLTHACWSLSSLCEANPYIHNVMDISRKRNPTLCETFIELLDRQDTEVVKAALRAIGNIVVCDEEDELEANTLQTNTKSNQKGSSHNNNSSNHDTKRGSGKGSSGSSFSSSASSSKNKKRIPSSASTTNGNGNGNGNGHAPSHARTSSGVVRTPTPTMSETQDYTQRVVDLGALPKLRRLISHRNKEIQKEACWTLSNIAAGKIKQIQSFIDSGVVPMLIEKAKAHTEAHADNDIRTEARWAILNCISRGTNAQIEAVANVGGIATLMDALDEADSSMELTALDGIDRVIEANEKYFSQIDPDRIFDMQRSPLASIGKRSVNLWQKHFVKCKICDNTFAKAANVTKYCNECKCLVCINCNCEVFHLSYQDELWKKDKGGKKEKKRAQQQSSGANGKSASSQSAKKAAAPAESVKNPDVPQKYVDYLLKTGSILQLAKLLEEEEAREMQLQQEQQQQS